MSPRNLSLTRAVADGDLEAVRSLLAEGANANGTIIGGQTPLIVAIIFRQVRILKLLLAAGADPQLRDNVGLNAIDWAERKGFTEGAKLIAESQSAKHDTLPTAHKPEPLPTAHKPEPTIESQSLPRSVEKRNPPPAWVPEQSTPSEQKTRQWLAGMKRRIDEEANVRGKEVQPSPPPTPREENSPPPVEEVRLPIKDTPVRTLATPREEKTPRLVEEVRVPIKDTPVRALATPREEKTPPPVEEVRLPIKDTPARALATSPEPPLKQAPSTIATTPNFQTNVAADTSQRKAEITSPEAYPAVALTSAADSQRKPREPEFPIDSWPTFVNRKRCPKCNAVYNSQLIAYCAVDMSPLVDLNQPGNQPAVTSQPATQTLPLIWTLLLSAFIAGAAGTYLIANYLSNLETASVPTIASQPQNADDKGELPVVGGELEGKALTLPLPEYPPTAKSEGVGGAIMVRVKVDKKGQVISTRSFEGDWRLRAAAIKAAEKATFSAEKLGDREAVGTIVYTFKP